MIRRLVPATVALACLACGGATEEPASSAADQTASYHRLCARCHGADREGTATAPGLEGLDELWTRDELVRYLQDPGAVTREIPRLQYVSEQYRIEMPSFGHLPPDELEALADDLLDS